MIKPKALILTYLSLDSVGGIEKVAKNIVELLQNQGWVVDHRCKEDLKEFNQLNTLRTTNPIYFDYLAPSLAFDWKRYNLVITNNLFGAAIYETKTTKVISFVHGVFTDALLKMDLSGSNLDELLREHCKVEQIAYHHKTLIVSIIKHVQNALLTHFNLQSQLLYNGFDFERFHSKRAFLSNSECNKRAAVGLYVARWDFYQKRVHVALKIMKHLTSIQWIIATDTDISEQISDNIKVFVNVPYEKMPQIYAMADFALQVSLYEGSSNFAMESTACMLPVVSTRVCILEEIYANTPLENLFIEQSDDEGALVERFSQKVEYLVQNLSLYRKILQQNHSKISTAFTIEQWRVNLRTIIDALVAHELMPIENVQFSEEQCIAVVQKYKNDGNVKQAIEALLNYQNSWSMKLLVSSVDVILYFIKTNTIGASTAFLHKIKRRVNHEHYYKVLAPKLLAKIDWFDLIDATSSSNYMQILIGLVKEEPKRLATINGITYRVCTKLIKLRQYEDAEKILHYLDVTSISAWLLLLSKVLQHKVLHGIQRELIPSDIFLENTIFHYRLGTKKVLIFFNEADYTFTGENIAYLVKNLRERKISLLVVNDLTSRWALQGLSDLSLDASIASLKEIVAQLDYQHVCTLGNSGPGLSALLYGLSMNVDGVFVINPLTRMNIVDIVKNKDIETVYQTIKSNLPTLEQLHASSEHTILDKYTLVLFGMECFPSIDIATLLHNNQESNVTVFYSKEYTPDKINTARIAGFKNVSINPVALNHHFLASYLIEKKMLAELLNDFFTTLNWSEF